MKKKTLAPLRAPNGKLFRVQNSAKPKLSNANDFYYFTYLQDENGDEIGFMFTTNELDRASMRALKNKEDFVAKGWLTDALD